MISSLTFLSYNIWGLKLGPYSKEYKLLILKYGFCDSYRSLNSDSKGNTFCNTNFYKKEGHDPSERLDY